MFLLNNLILYFTYKVSNLIFFLLSPFKLSYLLCVMVKIGSIYSSILFPIISKFPLISKNHRDCLFPYKFYLSPSFITVSTTWAKTYIQHPTYKFLFILQVENNNCFWVLSIFVLQTNCFIKIKHLLNIHWVKELYEYKESRLHMFTYTNTHLKIFNMKNEEKRQFYAAFPH